MSIGDVGKGVDRATVEKGSPQGPEAETEAEIEPAGTDDGIPRFAIRWFAEIMEGKLREGDTTKAPWSGETASGLLSGLIVELAELLSAATSEDFIRECADVANYAMMLAHNLAGNPGGCNREELKP